ncbi:MAG: Gfo/Idh/MocA family oxidoreductase [Bacteroidota bacterium]|nr:Gfo/Idh/MocA family oxidoreductase [Bacteroidota bacterium]
MINRKKFLGQAIFGFSGLALSSYTIPGIIIPQKNKKLGVALVGLGYYSTELLAPALQETEHCYLAGIVTGTPEKAEKWKQKYNLPDKNIYNYSNFATIADNPAIDVIYIVLPPSMHAEYSIKAAEAGKHVWCEKPMALNVKECQAMIDSCNKNKVKLTISYRMHHEPNTQQIMKFAKNKPYGNIQSISAAAGYFDARSNHWKQKKDMGGGAMYDMGVYPLNAIRYASGLEPLSVSAQASTTRPAIYHEVEETMQFDLELPGGLTAKGETSFGKNMNTLQVNASKGWYKLDPFQAYSGIKGETSDGKKLNASIPNQQARQMDNDALAILNNKPVLVPGEEGLKDIRVVEAIYRSVAEKKRVQIG